jgi:hypothetical protein
MGDGVLVYFGYPRAHEDDAERVAWLRAYPGAADRQYRALHEKTVAVSLRRAGMPEE